MFGGELLTMGQRWWWQLIYRPSLPGCRVSVWQCSCKTSTLLRQLAALTPIPAHAWESVRVSPEPPPPPPAGPTRANSACETSWKHDWGRGISRDEVWLSGDSRLLAACSDFFCSWIAERWFSEVRKLICTEEHCCHPKKKKKMGLAITFYNVKTWNFHVTTC